MYALLILILLSASPALSQITMRSDKEAALTSLRVGTNDIDSLTRLGRVYRYVAKGIEWAHRKTRVTVDLDSAGLVNRWAVATEGVDSNTFIRTYAADFNSDRCLTSTRNGVFIYGLLPYPSQDVHILYNLSDQLLQIEYVIPGQKTSFRFAKQDQ